jgi:hypothetical protein
MEIVSGRNLKCKDLQGGVKKVWLFPFVKYSRSQITVLNELLIKFPDSTLYEFQCIGDIGITQAMNENEGGKYYDTSFDIQIDNHIEIMRFLNFDFRAVILDRAGNYRLLGLWNGIRCNSINKVSGSNKSDFNGFKLSFDGQEISEAPYFYDLDLILGDYLLQENGDYLLQENGYKIKL